MPMGKGSYGSKRGRPPMKKNADKKPMPKTGKGSKAMKEKMRKLRAMKK